MKTLVEIVINKSIASGRRFTVLGILATIVTYPVPEMIYSSSMPAPGTQSRRNWWKSFEITPGSSSTSMPL